jgi:radical SAM protein with 4Fe4S-binding SPASM domain
MQKSLIYASDPWFPSSENVFTLFAAITHDCNLSCKHCFASDSQTTLDDEEWFGLFDKLSELENSRLFFTGGEPLIHPSFMKFADHSSGKGIPIILGTNATLITPHIAKDLFSVGVKEARVSIDGACAVTNDLLRGDGTFESAKKGVLSLIDEGISVSVRTTVNKFNYLEMDKIGGLIVSWGVLDWEIKHTIPTGRALLHPELLTTPQERAIALEMILKTAEANLEPRLNIKLMEGTIHRDAVIPESIKIASCPAGFRMMVVQPAGDVIPCGYLTSSVIGNVTQMTLSEIREKWKETNLTSLPTGCFNCRHKNHCKGGCPAYNFCI